MEDPHVTADLTIILEKIRNGDAEAPERLAVMLYEQLREMARREMASERPDHTLQPTALVHEAYLRLVSTKDGSFENRAHFFGAAAIAIRRVLVEHARKHSRLKRGGGMVRLDLDGVSPSTPVPDEAIIELDEALLQLASLSQQQARLVELRFFAGMTVAEIAALRGTSESTVQREWRLARAWLKGKLARPDES